MPKKSKNTPAKNDSVNPGYKLKKNQLRNLNEYIEGIRSGNRTLLSRAITLVESSKKEYSDLGQEILNECMPLTGNSIRIGITGVPGVGKSTFIESFGKKLVDEGKKIAVLTVDPSSSRTKGSILGDKTRMTELAANSNVYVRPSPTSGMLGGVAGKTREAMLLCEAAGFDTIIIETVGVGQSETSVKSMVDFFLLLMLAGAGDELQGMKRGIMEMTDMIVINKADGENIKAAERARLEYKNALSLFPPHESGWKTPVLTASALLNTGMNQISETLQKYVEHVKDSGFFGKNRNRQSVHWFHESIQYRLIETFYQHPDVKQRLLNLEKEVKNGEKSSFKAASELIAYFKK